MCLFIVYLLLFVYLYSLLRFNIAILSMIFTPIIRPPSLRPRSQPSSREATGPSRFPLARRRCSSPAPSPINSAKEYQCLSNVMLLFLSAVLLYNHLFSLQEVRISFPFNLLQSLFPNSLRLNSPAAPAWWSPM